MYLLKAVVMLSIRSFPRFSYLLVFLYIFPLAFYVCFLHLLNFGLCFPNAVFALVFYYNFFTLQSFSSLLFLSLSLHLSSEDKEVKAKRITVAV